MDKKDIKKVIDAVEDKIDVKAVKEAVKDIDFKKVANDIKKDGFDLSDLPIKDVIDAAKKK